MMAFFRGCVPFSILGGISLILYHQGKYYDAKSTFLVSLIAFFVGSATVVYNIESWSLVKQSIIHFVIMLITIYPILLFSGWFRITSGWDALKIFLFFGLVGLILWLFMFFIAKVFPWG